MADNKSSRRSHVKPRLTLASTSQSRIRWLKRLGYHFRVVAPILDEEKEERRWLRSREAGVDPRNVCHWLAREKAKWVLDKLKRTRPPGRDMVMGFDQGFFLRSRSGRWRQHHKPTSLAEARRTLGLARGQRACLVTAGAIVFRLPNGRLCARSFTAVTSMRFRSLTDREIEVYVATDRPIGCAGALRFESRGLSLLAQLSGGDPATLEGFPALQFRKALHSLLE